MNSLKLLGLLVLIAVVSCDVITFHTCPENACEISEVRVNPCPQAPEGPCKIKRGRSATIEFDFVANFNSPTLKNQAFWVSDGGDLPFLGLSDDGCEATTCPVVAGTASHYSMSLPISRKFPVGTYPVKWLVKGVSGEACCFLYTIKLTR